MNGINSVVNRIRLVLKQRTWTNYVTDIAVITGGIASLIDEKLYIAVICFCSVIISWGISIYLSYRR